MIKTKNSDTKDEKKLNNLDKAAEIATYYGFTPTEPPQITKEDIHKAKSFCDNTKKSKNSFNDLGISIDPEEKVSIFRTYLEKNMQSMPQPVMIYFEGGPQNNEDKSKKATQKNKRFNLEIIGTPKSVAEATLIKTSLEILKQEGFEDIFVDLNSVGDKESLNRFSRELTNYYRKNINSLASECKQLLKKDVFDLLECGNEKCREINEKAPQSISYLSEQSRQHFKEVLEFVESLGIPYRINNSMIGNKKMCSHTVFAIKNIVHAEDEKGGEIDETLALGYRYGSLSKKLDFRKEVPAIGVTISFKRKGDSPKKAIINKKPPKICYIQLGFEAKLKSLEVIEMLRREKIPVLQSLSKDKLTSQLASAEHQKIPFAIIMGQKEALENSVIVRNMNNRFQETVKIPNLPEYLKKHLD